MSTRVGMVSLGCPKNQVDAEHMLYNLRCEGFELVTDAALADVVIINTCGFIESAKQEAIDTILEFCTLKTEGRIKAVVVTGCLAERYREEIRGEMPEVDAVIGLGSNEKLVDIIRDIMSDGKQVESYGCKEDLCIDGKRIISTEPFYAYLKIAEGCSNCCTYCAIPSIRGKFRSREMQSIIDEAKWLAENGVTEIVIVAQDTTRYGEDLYGEAMLPQLLEKLCDIDGLKWIRTLYCYPERMTDELIDVVAKNDKLVKYFDIPVQHCNADVLKRMNRHGDKEFLKSLMEKIREKIPNCILRTTLITGFPGETQEQFEELSAFVKEVKFDRLGCFAYSAEEGTPAAKFDNQVSLKDREHRAEIIMDEQSYISDEKNQLMIGKTVEVVCEGFDRYAECYYGRSCNDAPEIDGKIFFISDEKVAVGQYVNILIDNTMDFDLVGTRV